MSVLVYVEAVDGKYKKTAYEACSYGFRLAQMNSANLVALTNADSQTASELASYGVKTVVCFQSEDLHDSAVLSSIIADAAAKYVANAVILTDDSRSKALLGRLAVKLDASAVSGASSLPESASEFQVSKSIFSSKAIGHYSLDSAKKVISVARNSVGIHENAADLSHEEFDASGYTSSRKNCTIFLISRCSLTFYKVLERGKLIGTNGPSGMQLTSCNTYFCSHTKLPSISKLC